MTGTISGGQDGENGDYSFGLNAMIDTDFGINIGKFGKFLSEYEELKMKKCKLL